VCYCTGRVYSDGGGDTAAPRASDSRTTTGRQLSRSGHLAFDDVITSVCDVTTSAAARRRQAGRRRTSLVLAAADYSMFIVLSVSM